MSFNIPQFLDNMRALMEKNQGLFGVMLERQVLSRVLPRVSGPRAELEGPLWALLVFCLDGPKAQVPPLDDTTWERAVAAARAGQALLSQELASFPAAASGVANTLQALREAGVFPPPRR